jgi:hypothetical protein
MLRTMSRRRFAISSAVLAAILIGVFPYVAISELWTFELADRIITVVLVAFFVLMGIGALIHAFRGTPFTRIGE